jgi:hypothetical protein
MRVDYQDGTGTGNILWRMGNQGDFALTNVNNDRWPGFRISMRLESKPTAT